MTLQEQRSADVGPGHEPGAADDRDVASDILRIAGARANETVAAAVAAIAPVGPSGSGYRHMTSGTEDGAAVAPIPIADGGTGQTTATLACTALLPTATTAGTIAVWNGTAWAILAPGSIGDTLKLNGSGVPAWTA